MLHRFVSWRPVEGRWVRLAVFLWAVVLVASVGRGLLHSSPRHQGIYAVYAEAGRHWLDGEQVYPRYFDSTVFTYSPLCAAGFVPFAVLPDVVGSMLWRLFLCGFYLLALRQWINAALPSSLTHSQQALLYLAVIPVTVPTLLNAQAGALVIALILFTIAAAAKGRWNLAALCIALATMLKLYPIAVGMLLAVVYPRQFIGRLAAALSACVLLPLVLQHPVYAFGQYRDWVATLQHLESHSWYRTQYNCDLRLLFQVWLTPMPTLVYRVIGLTTAAGAALLCWMCRQRVSDGRQRLHFVLALGGCWMALVGPAVESFTYILIGPTLAWLLVRPRLEGARPPAVPVCTWVLLAVASMAVWFPFGSAFHRMGPHPLAGLLLAGCVLADVIAMVRPHQVPGVIATTPASRAA